MADGAGPKNGTDRARSRRRKELLDAADRVIRRLGPGASMDDIAAEAAVTKPILYRHFGDKGGLYGALAERYVGELTARLRRVLTPEGDPRQRLWVTIDTYLSFVESHREAYRFLMHRAIGERPEAQAAVADFVRRVADEVAVILRSELERVDVDPSGAEPWGHGIVGMVQLAGDWWLRHKNIPRAQVVDHLVTLLWRGFSGLPVVVEPATARAGGARR